MMMALAIGFSACEGDQGEIGPKGDPGAQGEQGPAGEKGDAEATSFGAVVLTITGVDPKGNDFTEVVNYPYLPDNDPYSSGWFVAPGTDLGFWIQRETKLSANTAGRVSASDYSVDLYVELVEDKLALNRFSFATTVIVGNAYHMISASLDSSAPNAQDFVISNYAYNEATGALKFDFAYSYTDYSGNTVQLSGQVDVLVYEIQVA